MDIVYVSHVTSTPPSTVELASFHADAFPCLPIGSEILEQQRENSVCCLDRFYEQYNTLGEFGSYIANETLPLRKEIIKQNSCIGLNSPPSNSSSQLLNSALDFVSGAFARMPRSYSIIDSAVTRGYRDINIFLALEDVQRASAVKTPLVAGNRLRFFVGLAHLKTMQNTNRIVASTSQIQIQADITESYVFSTQTATDFTFIRDVSVGLSEVIHTDSGNLTKFAKITVIVPVSVTAADVLSIIPADSLTVSVGFSKEGATEIIYPCRSLYTGQKKLDIDTLLLEQDWCALHDPICAAQGPLAIGSGGSIQFTLPLPDSVWDKQTLQTQNTFFAQSIFINFMIVVADKTGKKIMTSMQTQTELKSSSITTQCAEELVKASIEEIVEIDMFLGLAGNESEFETSLVQSLDITKPGANLALKRDISSRASNVMTVLFKGDPELFDKHFAKEYTLAVEDIISLHFLNTDKKTQVEQLIADGLAFKKTNMLAADPNARTVMKLEPTAALLEICPMQATRNVFGCNARREINQRRMDLKSNAISALTGRSTEDAHFAHMRAGLWSKKLLGNTEYAKELGYNHSKIMHEKFNLNSRYRNGFLISPTIPWRQSEMDYAEFDSVFDLAQHTITTILVSFDTNFGQEFEASVELIMPLLLPLSAEQVIENQLLIAAAYAEGANLDVSNVYIDLASIVQQGTPSRRRNLLQSPEPESVSSTFNMVLGFALAKEEEAMLQATEFRKVSLNQASVITESIVENVNVALSRKVRKFAPRTVLINPNKQIAAPKSKFACFDTPQSLWELNVTHTLNIDIGTQQGKKMVGFISCQNRRVMLQNINGSFQELPENNVLSTNMSVRGPMNETDWQMVPRNSALSRTSALKEGWVWWDFCANPPRIADHSDAFLKAWTYIQSEAAQHCCACEASPKVSGTSRSYKHTYTWPLRLQDESFLDLYTQLLYPLISTNAAMGVDVYKINPQLRNFRIQYAASASNFETQNFSALPPLTWDIDVLGRTLFPTCEPGFSLYNKYECRMCPMGTFRQGDLIAFPLPADAYKRGGVCSNCPANTLAAPGSVLIADCQCDRGYFFSTNKCLICPTNTYRSTVSNVGGCLSCGTGVESRSGSTSITKCVRPISIGEYEEAVYIYNTVLGLTYMQTRVETTWENPKAIDQDQTPLCVLLSNGTSLDCGSGVYKNLFASTPIVFGTQDNALSHIEIAGTGSTNTNPKFLSFHSVPNVVNRLHVTVTPTWNNSFVVNGADRNDFKQRIKHISLFTRPGASLFSHSLHDSRHRQYHRGNRTK